MIPVLILILLGVAIYCAAVFHTNRRARPHIGPLEIPATPTTLPAATDTLTVMTWNIGYGALGKNADLIVDKGRSFRALSAADIRLATRRIAQRLADQTADIICLQENANAGFLTRNVPVRTIIESALTDRQNLFWSDMKSVLVPRFLNIEHGMSVHAGVKIHICEAVTFPQDSTYFYGGLTKHYGGLINRIAIANTDRDWVVFNIHLSAFEPDVRSRVTQFQDLMRLAQNEYEKGHFVVIAGDWNMGLTPTDFAHRTNAADMFTLMDFPHSTLMEGWNVAVDAATPTVRSLNARYATGQNYTTIIDGFICSPNVAVTQVSTTELGFEDTDHHPVKARFATLA